VAVVPTAVVRGVAVHTPPPSVATPPIVASGRAVRRLRREVVAAGSERVAAAAAAAAVTAVTARLDELSASRDVRPVGPEAAPSPAPSAAPSAPAEAVAALAAARPVGSHRFGHFFASLEGLDRRPEPIVAPRFRFMHESLSPAFSLSPSGRGSRPGFGLAPPFGGSYTRFDSSVRGRKSGAAPFAAAARGWPECLLPHKGDVPTMNPPLDLLRAAVAAAVLITASPACFAGYPLPPEHTGARLTSAFDVDRIIVHARDGSALFSFTHADLDGPRGIAFGADGRLYVGCENSSRVLVFDAAFAYQTQFGSSLLRGATGLAFGPDGNLYVGSAADDAVVVFTPDGAHVTTLRPAGLDSPNCPAFDAEGNLYVASMLTDTVLVLDPAGAPIRTLSDPDLDSPMSVAFDAAGAKVFVSGGLSDKVVVFDRGTGAKIGVLADPLVPTPQGVAVDDLGQVHVSSFVSGCIVVFDPTTGTVVRCDRIPTAPVLRSMALEPLAPHVAVRRGNVGGSRSDGLQVLLVNGSAGDRHHRTAVNVGDPLNVELLGYPGAMPGGIRYVAYVKLGENGPADLSTLPRGTGTAPFSIPPTSGSPIVLASTLGHEPVLGTPRFPGTPLGPGVVFAAPRIPARYSGLVFTTFFVVVDACAPNGRAALTNAHVVTVP